jgi:hypothetical protein
MTFCISLVHVLKLEYICVIGNIFEWVRVNIIRKSLKHFFVSCFYGYKNIRKYIYVCFLRIKFMIIINKLDITFHISKE